MKLSTRLATGSLLAAFVAASRAVPFASIDVGDTYYVRQDLDTALVRVTAIDQASKRIKVRYDNGAVDWVTPGELLTQRQNEAEEAATVGAVIGILACALDPSDAACRPAEWKPGSPHSRWPNVVAAPERDRWRPAPGYRWEEAGRFGPVVWAPGKAHPDYAHVIAASAEGRWLPMPGYRWQNPPNLGAVIWTPGMLNRDRLDLAAGDLPDRWVPAPGYRWANPTDAADFTVVVAAPR